MGSVSQRVPLTFSEREIDEAEIHIIVETTRSPLEIRHPAPGAAEVAIAHHINGLVEDGATIQLGLGALPETILARLSARELGIHSGLIGDQVASLMESGVITNARKSIDPGVSVAGIMIGTRSLYEFANQNRSILLRPTSYTHALSTLSRIDNFVALNSAIEARSLWAGQRRSSEWRLCRRSWRGDRFSSRRALLQRWPADYCTPIHRQNLSGTA